MREKRTKNYTSMYFCQLCILYFVTLIMVCVSWMATKLTSSFEDVET